MSFVIGQRVIVKAENLCGTVHAGYYGHIDSIETPNPAHNQFKQTLYNVRIVGRHGLPVAPWMMEDGVNNPYPFFEDELEAAD